MSQVQVPGFTQQYNNFSEKLLATLPPLDNAQEKVRFRLLPKGNNLMETLTVGGTSEERLTMPHSVSLPLFEDIIDPATEQYVRIARFDGVVTPTSQPKPTAFTRENLCVLEVNPTRQPDLYRRLMFSEYNQNNPNPRHRTPADGYMFEVEKPELTEKQKRQERILKMKAQEFIEFAELSQLLRLAPKAQVAVPVYKDEEGHTLRNNFTLAADVNPQFIINLFEADDEKLFTLVDAAVKHEVIQFDASEAKWVLLPARQFLAVALPGVKAEDAMVQFLILPDNAPVLKAIRAAVKQKESK